VELEAEPEIGPEIEPVVVATPAAAEDDDGAETELFASEIAGSDEEEDVTMARYQTEEVRPEEITVPEIAGELAGSDVGRAVFISPEGDEATAVSVTVARSLADAGLRTLFLDLTWSGAPSSAMLEEEGRAGITDLLASRAQFADIIHGDLYSGCHVVPAGTVDPVEAMRAADRLPAILEALDDAYDVVVIECGAADAQTIADVTAADSEVLIGALDPRNRTVAGVAADLATLGYGAVLTVTPGARPTRLRRRGSLAA
jgi:Mrp family chromosome partitioning ATPase